MNSTALAWRRLLRGLRSGELRVLLLALVVAVAAAVAVGLFSGRVRAGIERGTGEALGADAIVSASEPFSADYLARLRALAVRLVSVVQFPSMVGYGEGLQLATIKAVEDGYPPRGQLSIADQAYAPMRAAAGVPSRGEAWADPRLWSLLSLVPGAELRVGAIRLQAGAAIADEPGRGGAFAELAPELLINAADLPATQLIAPGSRVQYQLLLAGEPAAIEAARAVPPPKGARFLRPGDSRQEIQQTLQRAQRFLNIAVLASLLLSAAAIALGARRYGLRLRDEVALLKTLGAQRSLLLRAQLHQLLLLGVCGAAGGMLLGVLGQWLLGQAAGSLPGGGELPLPTPIALASMFAAAAGLVLLLLLGFALPPLWAALAATPVRVFQRLALEPAGTRPAIAAATLAAALLLGWQVGDARLALYVVLAALLTALALGLCAWLLLRALARLRGGASTAWRFGLANLARRGGATVAQAVALGIALLALLFVSVVRQDLLAAWRDRLPAQTPNQFLINIQPDQRDPLRRFFADHGHAPPVLWPMVRARLTALNGRAVTAESFEDPETRRWINREFNLSWTEGFSSDNELISGSWWSAADQGRLWLSADEYAVQRLQLKVGDTLTLDVAGRPFTLSVHNTRKVHWDSFKPNFFLVVPPGVLEDSGAVQWITSFYLPPQQRALLRELAQQFPNITALDLDAALAQVRGMVERVVHALELVFGFTLAAGLVVMLAVMEASREERVRETGVLRTLGASSRTLRTALLAEYATLGLLSGAVAAIAAQALAWVLAARVFEIPYGPRPLLWLAGSAAGMVIVALAGWLSLRGTLRTPPRQVLAAA